MSCAEANIIVVLFAENERLPYELGWSKQEVPITTDDLLDMMGRIVNVTGSSPEEAANIVKRGDIHAGLPIVG